LFLAVLLQDALVPLEGGIAQMKKIVICCFYINCLEVYTALSLETFWESPLEWDG